MVEEYEIDCGGHKLQFYEYDNCKFAATIFFEGMDSSKLADHMSAFNKMEIRDDDVLILTYPKSGTHLLREIVHMLQTGRQEYIKDVLDFPIEYRDTKEVASMKSPRTMHTHLPYRMLPEQIRINRRGKVVALMRNPKDVVVSYWHFLRKASKSEYPLENLVDVFIKGDIYHNSWYEWRKGLVEGKKQYGDIPILVLKYEDCIGDLKGVIRSLAKYLEKDISEKFVEEIAEHCNIEKMRKEKTRNQPKDVAELCDEGYTIYYRKGVIGEWKSTLSEELNSSLDKWISSQVDDGFDEFPDYLTFYKES